MDKVQYNVIYNRKNRLLTDGTALIQIEAYLKGKKKYFSTGIYITPDNWDKKHRAIKNHPNKISLNKEIRDFVNSLENAELQRRQNGNPFTLEYLGEFVKGNSTDSFIDFCTREMDASNLRESSKIQHRTTISYLQNCKGAVTFEALTYELLSDFEKYLRDKSLHQNSIVKHFSILRRYVNLAIDKEYIEQNKYPFRKFKTKKAICKRDYLTPEEMELMENVRLPDEKKHLQTSLDLFMFSVYTGMRYGDVVALKPEHLTETNGAKNLNFQMQKTSDPIRIPISELHDGRALKLFAKYAGNGDTVFPYKANKYLNREIAELAKLANINKHVTFHVARHTQATYLLFKGVSITTVQKLMGHKNIATTQVYGKVMDMTVDNELKNISFSRKSE